MRFGHRFLVLLHVDDPHLRIGLSGGSTDWNGREWLNSDRLPPANAQSTRPVHSVSPLRN
jgi:hypothetical protein